MKAPTAKQVAKNIAWLKENIKNLPARNAFGENIQSHAEAELVVLKEDLSEDDINDRSQFEDDESTEENEWTPGQRESAMFARQWLDGEEESSPIENFKALVGRKFTPLPPPR